MINIQSSNSYKENLSKEPEIIEEDNIFYKINETEKTAYIFDNNFAQGTIFIPRSIEYQTKEFIITKILKESFAKSSILSINFPADSELKVIEEKSFFKSKLATISIPPSVFKLSDGCFDGAKKLKTIQIHPNNPNYKNYKNEMILCKSNKDSEIFDSIFYVSRKIKSFIIPSNIKQILPYSFQYSILTKIHIPSHIIKICKFAFSKCFKLKEITFSDDSELKTIEEKAFDGTDIKELIIPSKVCELKYGWCSSLHGEVKIDQKNQYFKNSEDNLILGKTNKDSDIFDIIVFAQRNEEASLTISPNIKIISPYAFADSKLQEISFPSNVTFIDDYAFFNCRNLHKIDFPENSKLQIIGKYAFSRTNVDYVKIPRTVKKIGKRAFYFCGELRKVEISIDSELQEIEKESFSSSYNIEDLIIPSKVSKLTEGWCWELNINISVMKNNQYFINYENFILGRSNINSNIYDELVYAKRDLTEISIPNFIKKICPYSFAKSLIRKVFIPKNVIEICEGAFDQIYRLKKVDIEDNSELKIIGCFSFLMTNIDKFVVPKNINVIEERAFYFCNLLIRVEISEDSKLKIIKKEAFKASGIKSVFLPKSVIQIQEGAFDCSNIQIFQIEEGSKVKLNLKKVFGPINKTILLVPKQISDNFF